MAATTTLKHILLALTCAATPALVSAAPIVLTGSSYGYLVLPSISASSAITGVTFDGVAETFVLSSFGGPATTVVINESQNDLGGGAHSVVIDLTANADLFPTANEIGTVNIGRPGNDPLNLLRPVRLVSAFLTFYSGTAALYSADFVSALPGTFGSLNPWDGYFLANTTAGGFNFAGGLGINRVELRFGLQEVPEPQTLALVGASLLLLAALRRRQAA